MKRFFFLILMTGVLLVVGCKDNATAPTNPGGGGIGGGGTGGGNTGNVTFTAGLAQDNQQQYYFEFKPNTAVVINTVTANCAAANVNNQQVQDNGTTVYDANNPMYIGPVTILAQGQQWSFTIAGKVGSSTGAAYSSTVQLTIQ